MTRTNNTRRSRRNRANNRHADTVAFDNAFGNNPTAPAPQPQPIINNNITPALARMADGTGMQVDAPATNQPPPPPDYQNPAAVVEALAAVEQPPAAIPVATTQNANNSNNSQQVAPPAQNNRRQRRGAQTGRRRQAHSARPPRRVKTVEEKYEPSLRSLMNHKLHRIHEVGHQFSRDELLSLTDDDICKWMKFPMQRWCYHLSSDTRVWHH